MALIVEDGTGLTNAETYVSVSDANAYHSAMGNTAWSGTDAAKEVALRRAAQYIDTRYTFRGHRLNSSQALQWPRVYVRRDRSEFEEVWPIKAIKDACCEAALRALTTSLYADTSADVVTRETVGPITVEYDRKTGQTRYPVVDALIAQYATGGAFGLLRVERAA